MVDESELARERILEEPIEGDLVRVTFADGTVVAGGRVIKAGPEAIVEGDKLLGWKR